MNKYAGRLCFMVMIASEHGTPMSDLCFEVKFFVYGHPRKLVFTHENLTKVDGKYYAFLDERTFVDGALFCEAVVKSMNRVVTMRVNTGYVIGGTCDCVRPSSDSSCGFTLSVEKVERPDTDSGELVAEELYAGKMHLPELIADRSIADENGNRITDTYVTRNGLTKHIQATYNEQFLENPPLVTDGYITPAMLSEDVKGMLAAAGATINNLPDGEDLKTVNGVLKFADKDYNAGVYSGLGRVYLRKNIVAGVNVLTQKMMSKKNTIYVIQYDYDLRGEEITVPEGCVLDFQGGSFSNGTIVGDNTAIKAGLKKIFELDVYFDGNWNNKEFNPVWFGAIGDGIADDTKPIKKVLDSFETVNLLGLSYFITDTLYNTIAVSIIGGKNPINTSKLIMSESLDVLLKISSQYTLIDGVSFIGPTETHTNGVMFKKGTTAIDSTNPNSIRLESCSIYGFEYGIKSKYNSFYNKFSNCRFRYIYTVFDNFSSNNFIVESCKFDYFKNAFIRFIGDGQMNVVRSSFEKFSGYIFQSYQPTRNFSFCHNYVEPTSLAAPPCFGESEKYGGNILFNAEISNFVAFQNEYQISASKCLYQLITPRTFVSISNNLMLIASSVLNYYFNIDSAYTDAEKLISKLIIYDNLNDKGLPEEYFNNIYKGSIVLETAKDAIVHAIDPIKNKPILSKSIRHNAVVNYEIFGNTGNLSYFSLNNICYLRGSITIKEGKIPKEGDLVATLTNFDKFGSFGGNVFDSCYIKCFDSDYNNVLLKFNYSDKTITYVGGNTSGPIIFDGSYIILKM